MAKPKTIFACQHCGHQSPRWLGRCPDCGEWQSFVEETFQASAGAARGGKAPAGGNRPEPLSDVEGEAARRTPTGIAELDRVLGGGVVEGSAVLIGGDPGIGKSTLLLDVADRLGRAGGKVLYVTGEESIRQTKIRAERLGLKSPGVLLLAETSLERILEAAEKTRPSAVVVDSVQTVFSEAVLSAPGTVSQVRESGGRLMRYAKESGTALFLIGHVTKEGMIAGPKVLEHLVDTVLYFEGDRGHAYRLLRSVKNRFGPTHEVGVFEMAGDGLREVANPSDAFLSERPKGAPGSVVVPVLEGTRPLLVEIQALVSPTPFALPRRTSLGVDLQRASLLIAVLEKRAGVRVGGADVFVNVAGGVSIEEPAADLGVVVAVASSALDRPVDGRTIVFGEVGLAGEVRAAPRADLRLKEAAKLGFERAVVPRSNLSPPAGDGIRVEGVASVQEALAAILGGGKPPRPDGDA